MSQTHTPIEQAQPPVQKPVILTRDKETESIKGMETLIMRTMVRYGEKTILTADEEDNVTETPIIIFLKQQLEMDNMEFITPLYKNMIDEVIDKVGEDGFSCSKYYLTSPDINVCNAAAEMLNDKYHVDDYLGHTEPEENTLETTVPRLILDYKYFVVKKELQTLKRQLADPQVVADTNKLTEVMKRYKLLTDVQKQLALELGERIIQ